MPGKNEEYEAMCIEQEKEKNPCGEILLKDNHGGIPIPADVARAVIDIVRGNSVFFGGYAKENPFYSVNNSKLIAEPRSCLEQKTQEANAKLAWWDVPADFSQREGHVAHIVEDWLKRKILTKETLRKICRQYGV